MSTPIRIKRSAVPGKRPTTGQLLSAELAYNTYDGELTAKRERPGIGTDIIRIGAGTTVTNILYVTKDGNDTNTGRKLGDAKATIKGAVAQSTAGTVIEVAAGSYIEDNPIVLPDEVSVVGNSLREVTVIPQNVDEDLFLIGKGNYIAEMSYRGSLNPGKAIFAFDPNNQRYIDQSPYVQNCTNFIPDSIGMRIDGNDVIGPLKSMVLDSYTQYNQNGIGISITNAAYAQLVSLFTICPDIAVYTATGGACDLTNSNASFGNYGLVADGVSPVKYTGILTSTSAVGDDTFVVNVTTPTLNITNASYDNTTGILTAFTSTPHNFSVGMGVSIVGLGFTCPFEPGTRFYPSGQKGYVFDVKTVAPGRYIDASNLINANRTEIVDKSLAAIAISHPDFVFPGDSGSDASYRYKDSYRLIQQNRQEIVDKSLASIALGFPSGFRFPTDPVPYIRNRYYDASRLIQINRQEIVDKSLAAIAIDHPDFYFPGDTQTNNRSRYYDAYRLIQNNRTEIVNTAWTNTVASYPGISTTQTKCKRDLGFFIDAVSADVFTGGNNYAKQFTLQYFDAVGNPISNGLVGEVTESIFAFNQARNLMKSAITNQLTYQDLSVTTGPARIGSGSPFAVPNTSTSSCSDVQDNIDTLTSIVTTTVGAGSTFTLPVTNLGSFTTGGTKCARDIGYLVDALATDVFTGGNAYARGFTLQYFDNSGVPISNGLVGEESQSITAFAAVRDYAKKAVTNQLNLKNIGISSGPANYGSPGIALTVYPSGNADACADVQSNIDNLVGIVTAVIGVGSTASLPTLNLGISTTNKCARDLGYFVDAVSTDLFTGGNSYIIAFTRQYFTSVGAATTALLGEESQSIYAFNSARDYAKKAITNQLNIKDLTVTADPNPGIGTTSNTNTTSCANVQSTINTLVGIATQSIAAGNLSIVNGITLNGGTFLTGESKCRRDIGYIVDAVSSDVRNFTNRSIIAATESYFTSSGVPISNGLVGETAESITAFRAVGTYSKLAINNILNVKDLTVTADPLTGSNVDPLSCANVRSNIDTLVGIITTFVGQGSLTTPLALPSVSTASTVFTLNVGIATQPHTYVPNTGTAKINIIRPFDGQSIYFDDLYYTVGKIRVGSAGTGYINAPTITISDPTVPWGISAAGVAEISNGSLRNIEIVSSGRGYTAIPTIQISSPDVGINTATATIELFPSYYSVLRSTPISAGICTITINENIPYVVNAGAQVPFYKQSRILASGHSFEYIGSGTDINTALPNFGGVPIQDNEVDMRNGGLVVYTSTDQGGNFRIGEGVAINQLTGTISGSFYSKSLFSTITPFILALGGT
jgi:hypothetical protein